MVVSFIYSFIPSLTYPKNVLNASSEKSLVENIKDTDMNSTWFLSRYIHGLTREMDSEQTECSHRNNHRVGSKDGSLTQSVWGGKLPCRRGAWENFDRYL